VTARLVAHDVATDAADNDVNVLCSHVVFRQKSCQLFR
jgi:hypothetical protein